MLLRDHERGVLAIGEPSHAWRRALEDAPWESIELELRAA